MYIVKIVLNLKENEINMQGLFITFGGVRVKFGNISKRRVELLTSSVSVLFGLSLVSLNSGWPATRPE